MKRSKTQAERLFDIHGRIQRKEYPNCRSLSSCWEVSEKTIQRDIEFLKYRLDAPIAYDYLKRGYYYTDTTFMLPAFPFSEGEFISLLMTVNMMHDYRGTPIADTLMSVCGKLSDILPDTVSVRPEDLFMRFSAVMPPSRAITSEIWTSVLRGLLYRKVLDITYTRTGNRTFRVHPLHLANLQGDWYLYVRYEGYDNFRQLSLHRIQKATVLDESADDLISFNPSDEIGNSFGRFAGDNEPFEVELHFQSDVAEQVFDYQWHPRQRIDECDDGSIDLHFPAKGLDEVMRWVLAWGHQCIVRKPAELIKLVDNEARRICEEYSKETL